MIAPTVVVVNGPPGAGKTTLGKQLATDLNLPFIGKDDFKEILFDCLGLGDREWSKRLGVTSIELIFHVLEQALAAGQSAVIESAFVPDFDIARFDTLQQRHAFEVIQLFCYGDPDVLTARFFQRDQAGDRHPGHIVPGSGPIDFKAMLKTDKYGVLDIGGELIRLDTTDFNRLDYETILTTIRASIKRI